MYENHISSVSRALLTAASVFALALLSVVLVSADPGDDDAFMIDDMSDVSPWSSVSGSVSYMRYGTDTSYLSTGEDDTGYLTVRNYDIMSGEPLEVSRAFDTPVNLYEYDEIGFYINIANTSPEAAVTSYTVAVTLYSRGRVSPYTYSSECDAGEWVRFTAAVGDFSMRTDVVGISVSVTAQSDSDAPVRLSFRLDGIGAETKRDTSHEERFLSESFESRGGRIVYDYEDNCYTLVHTESGGRVTGYPVIADRSEGAYDVIRFTLSESVRAEAVLEVTYLDGETTEASSQTVSGGSRTALFFQVDSIEKIYMFTLRIRSAESGELRLYGVELLRPSGPAREMTGTIDTCRISPDGSVNIRGTVPTETVADHIDCDLAVYAVPIYADMYEYIKEGTPSAVIDMTTRFNIKIDGAELPAGYEAMRYIAVIERDDESIVIAEAFASFADEAGARLPASGGSIKGISPNLPGAGAAVTFIDIRTDELFGTASSGRLYSFGGSVYYFDNDCVSSLDMKIKSASLTGTSCFIRLRDENGYGIVLSADDEESYARLYAAVDYLTGRYSSVDYGFISGISLGERFADGGETGDASASLSRMLASAYRIGRANIAGFRIVMPIGGELASAVGADTADILYDLSRDTVGFDGVPYELLIETSDGLALLDSVISFSGMLAGNAPSGIYVLYSPDKNGSGAELLADYASKYYDACGSSSVSGFILASGTEGLSDYELDRFVDGFCLLDTNEYRESEKYAGIEANSAPERAHPISLRTGFAMKVMRGIAGEYGLFSFTDSFSTAGWFSYSGEGECSTVRTGGGRALRAGGECLGIMYSCADAPLDMSAAPMLRIDAYASESGSYELTLYSASGIYRADFDLGKTSSSYWFDISGFDGVSSVTGISLVPNANSGEIFVSGLSLCSREYDDQMLLGVFAAQPADDVGDTGESNMLEIMAVSLLSLALGAGTIAVLSYRTRELKRKNVKYEQV